MTTLYRKINIPNLELLQDQLRTVVPKELYTNPRFYFFPDQSKLLKLPELVKLLDINELKHDITNFGIYAMPPVSEGPVHIDWGKTAYSMNIPIADCDNTFTCFYKADKEPLEIPARVIKGTKYNPLYSFESVNLELIDQFESNVPYIMSIKTPHKVINKNPKFRITFLIRYWDNDHMSSLLKGGSPAI